ncbi:copper transporter [Nocardioides sp. YIM 152315]|uniref:copper transporter n=1 Tax=Nocardioides sp. YIM 152315 TaxID=3031760 RepID=UPI0023DB37A3|nr:copper transporter [Nocardioides sp. YIM 152315]MDF1606528.1 copper transporter [Nocardioides sp. YIM 152315]
MISYRHHIVSLVAVFVALAVGVVLGGGPLTDLGRDEPAAATVSATRTDQRSAEFGDAFATASAPTLYGARLQQHPVAIVAMPGADNEVVGGLADQVAAAGGQVAGTYAVRAALVDPAEKSLVDTLGAQLADQLGDEAVAPDASTYPRIGQLLGLAVAPGDLGPADLQAVRESLGGAELLDTPADVGAAALVLVVLGDRTDPAVLGGVVSGLAAKAPGVVVAGETPTAAANGDLGALRATAAAENVATVDGAENPLGQVTTVLALIRSLTTPGGSFGASGSDGAVPLT